MIRQAIVAALAALAITPAAGRGQEQVAEHFRVTAVLAHPDDELPMAPALAALSRQGHFVTIIHATAGDAGPGVSDLAPGEQLAKIRRQEAQCAATALGISFLDNLSWGDGRLWQEARGKAAQADTLIASISAQIADADIVLTWGPDGGYGHADHRMVSALATQIVQAMPAAARPKLLYVGIPAGRLPPVPEMAQWATTDPALLTESIAYTPADLAAASAAAQCHETQFDAATRAGMMPLFDATIWQGAVHFREAFGRPFNWPPAKPAE